MMRPWRWRRMAGATAWASSSGAVRLTASVRSQAASLTSPGRLQQRHAGAVDQDVDAARGLQHGGHRLLHALGPGHIHRQRQVVPGLRQAGSGHVQCLPLQVQQDDTRTAFGELPGNRQADAARRRR